MENVDLTKYELMLVAFPGKGDEIKGRVEKFIKDADATNVSSDSMGKKPLAYKIRKQTEADFILFNFEVTGGNLKSISDKLRLEQDDLLRHLLLTKHDLKKSKKKGKKVEAPKEVEVKEAPKVTVVTKVSTKASVGKKVKAEKKAKTVVKKGKKK